MDIRKEKYNKFIRKIKDVNFSTGITKRLPNNLNLEQFQKRFASDTSETMYKEVEGLLVDGEDAKEYSRILDNLSRQVIAEVKENIDYINSQPIINKYLNGLMKELKKTNNSIKIDYRGYKYINPTFFRNTNESLEQYMNEISEKYKTQKNCLRSMIIDLSQLKEKVTGTSYAVGETENYDAIIDYSRPYNKIQLLDNTNLLATLFYDLHRKGYIKTSKTNLEAFFLYSFIDRNGGELNKTTIHDYFKDNKEDKRAAIGKRILVQKKN